VSDYVYTDDGQGNCLLCGCPDYVHDDGWCPDASEPTEPDPDHLRD
jgi:hypothetical protein